MCWKTSQGTQYTGGFPKEVLAWVTPERGPRVFLKLCRNTANLIASLPARQFTAFPKYDHENNNNQPPNTLDGALF